MILYDTIRPDMESYHAGEILFRRGSVSPASTGEDALCYKVGSNPTQTVLLYRDGQAVGTLPPAEYAGYVRRLRDAGVSVFGGCCGTTPAHIAAMRAVLDEKKP